jgi:hypothetical protein
VSAAVGGITPEPTEEEAAAIVASVPALLSGGGADGDGRAAVSRWRFSGRWWSRPVPIRRIRP